MQVVAALAPGDEPSTANLVLATLRAAPGHFRQFLMVRVEGGKDVYFRFYDPRVLRDFLPTSLPGEVLQFFGPVTQWLVESEDPGRLVTLTHEVGRLHATSS